MSAILKEDPQDLAETNRNVSPALERIVRHCLEKSPAERFQSARDVAFNLEALSDISSTSRAGVKAIPEPAGRRWMLPLLATILVLASWAAIYRFARGQAASNPKFHEITFRNGTIWDARFAPDGQNIIYGAAWEGAPQEVFSTRSDSSDSRPVGLQDSQILSISSSGEMAISLHPRPSGPSRRAEPWPGPPGGWCSPRGCRPRHVGRLGARRPISAMVRPWHDRAFPSGISGRQRHL